jgi:hypothetical protein
MTRTRYRWFIIFLLFAISAVNYIDRAAISYAIPLIQRNLGLTLADTGIILGAFGLGYAITTLVGRFAVDHYGARVVLARRRHLVEPVDRHHRARQRLRRPLRGARAAGRVGRAQLPRPHRRGQPLAFAARAGDRIELRLAGRAAGACDRRLPLHGAPRLARLASHFCGLERVLVTLRCARRGPPVHPAAPVRHRCRPPRAAAPGPRSATDAKGHGQAALHGLVPRLSKHSLPRGTYGTNDGLAARMHVHVLNGHLSAQMGSTPSSSPWASSAFLPDALWF